MEPYVKVGARLEWNLNVWGTTKREKQILSLHQKMVQSERENFIKTVNQGSLSLLARIDEVEAMIKMDQQLLDLQIEILEEAKRQFDLGVMSSTDYISELNQQTQAELQLGSHKIERQKLMVELLTLTGNI
jgi:outer membrane protein TolC